MNNLTKITALSVFILPFFSFTSAKAENQFDVCVRQLIDSSIPLEMAQSGCSGALEPKDLSYCVSSIAKATDINATDALKSCYQVRRPVEMGNCVVQIKNQVLSQADNSSSEMMALNTCQASLLPARHSECVIALSRTPAQFDPLKAMETCISANDFPNALFKMN